MQRPEVRIIDNQQETVTSAEASQSEIDRLLYKYGYQNNTPQQYSEPINNQSFEDMIRQQEQEIRSVEEEKYRKLHGPKAITFDNNNINYSEVKYSDMDIDGNNTFGIKIQIVTDMKF